MVREGRTSPIHVRIAARKQSFTGSLPKVTSTFPPSCHSKLFFFRVVSAWISRRSRASSQALSHRQFFSTSVSIRVFFIHCGINHDCLVNNVLHCEFGMLCSRIHSTAVRSTASPAIGSLSWLSDHPCMMICFSELVGVGAGWGVLLPHRHSLPSKLGGRACHTNTSLYRLPTVAAGCHAYLYIAYRGHSVACMLVRRRWWLPSMPHAATRSWKPGQASREPS